MYYAYTYVMGPPIESRLANSGKRGIGVSRGAFGRG